jgi:excisionase family DNA binding protein
MTATLNVKEAAHYLGVGATTIYALVKRRELRKTKILRVTRFLKAELDRFLERNTRLEGRAPRTG